MKKIFHLFLFILTFSFLSLEDLKASHIIGGELTYECKGNAQGGGKRYDIKVTMYRDCSPGSISLPNTVTIDAFSFPNGQTNLLGITSNAVELEMIDLSSDDDCIEIPDVCIEKGEYILEDVVLPETNVGIYLKTSSIGLCCLSSETDNVANPTSEGFAFTALIPKKTFNTCYESPVFNLPPPNVLCLYDEDLVVDLSAAELPSTSESFSYDYFHPYSNTASTPPFDADTITFLPGYSSTFPFDATPPMAMNSVSGQMTGMPIEQGKFVNGARIQVLDNTGDTVAYIERVYRYLVVDCNINNSNPVIASANASGNVECGELNVDFGNTSFNANSYKWIFGDGDTTNVEAPNHTYPDYGPYEVKLISYADNTNCNDTAIINILLEGPVDISIEVNNDNQCLSNNSFDFKGISSNPNVSYEWDFGSIAANPQTSTLKNPSNINYTQTGTFQVNLKTTYKECVTEETMNITVFDGKLAEVLGPKTACVPFENAVYTPSVLNNNYQYTWSIGKDTFIGPEYVYNFTKPGIYPIYLHVLDLTTGCESYDIYTEYTTIYERPVIDFKINDYFISAGETVEVETTEENGYPIEFYINGELIQDTNIAFLYTFEQEGDYTVLQRSINGDCITELEKVVKVGPREVDPPNIFTPNGDDINDFFIFNPFYNNTISIYIYDRWGTEVFYSSNYENCTENTTEFCWDGTNRDGNNCETGIYFYILRQGNNAEERKGSVTLER